MYGQLRRELGRAEGELPLLNATQLRFLDEVADVVDRRVGETAPLYAGLGNEGGVEILEVMCASETHLMTIVRRLRSARASKLRFVQSYPGWCGKRRECLENLTVIADSINSDRFNCNVSKLVGYCSSFLGGGLTIASLFLLPVSLPLVVAGGSLIFAGCGTAVGTAITEIALLKSKVEQAKKLIDEDREYFRNLGDWLAHATDLQEALESVLGIDVLREVVDDVSRFVKECVRVKNDDQRRRRIQESITRILTTLMPLVTDYAVPVVAVATFLTVLVTIFLLLINTENRVVFDFTSVTIRSVLGVASLVDDSMDILRLSSILPGGAAATKEFAKAVTRGAVAVVGMALDVIGIAFVSKDIHAGSLSPEAEKIKEAVKQMGEEAGVLAHMYDSLQ